MANSPAGHVYTINGVKVHFPVKAYPSQLSMMDKIIKGIERKQNSLLESPTGSGKSLALLCAALAWQEHEYEKAKLEEEESCKSAESECCSNCATMNDMCNNNGPGIGEITANQHGGKSVQDPVVLGEEEDDFKPQTKKLKGAQDEDAAGLQWTTERIQPTTTEPEACCSCQSEDKPKKRKVPRIYFGTRTHKQIAQIARELGKTAYRNAKMCILSSREHTCIDPEVSSMPSGKKNEECKNKLDGPGCRFFDQSRKISQRNIKTRGLNSAWDLEDFVSFCRKYKACPYFGVRQLKDNSDIVFCPYNYLIEPGIRSSMDIVLKDQIVILDEAHNIEDSARDAASYKVTQKELQDACQDIRNLINFDVKPAEHGILLNMCERLGGMMEHIGNQLEGSDFDQASRTWHGMDMVAQLSESGLGPKDGEKLTKAFHAVMEEDDPEVNRGPTGKIHSSSIQTLESLLRASEFIYKEDMRYMEDYRLVLVKTMSYGSSADNVNDDRWLSKRRRGRRQLEWMYILHFWCLNPAVAFTEISVPVRSVIVTSGTLAPLNTFQSELGTAFPIQLEANHVIGRDQVWVGTISRGPRGTQLLGSYQNTETFAYQDEIGGLVLQVCQTVPHGVLCFLSSYKMLNKLSLRWKDTGLWTEVQKTKMILCEPRRGDKEDFDSLIKRFYDVIQDTGNGENGDGINGALFLAVCRGKVSEGIDFADNNARAVITVGIPFPNIKDSLVGLKRQYNNKYCASRGLLSGSAWYEIQAYRAINQALGRCIRHRHDWGALILVDERFSKNPEKYIKGLSKWVRQRVQYYSTFQQAQNSLREYTQRLQAEPVVDASMTANTSSLLDVSAVVTPNKPEKLFPLFNIPNPRTPNLNIQAPIAHAVPNTAGQVNDTKTEIKMLVPVISTVQAVNTRDGQGHAVFVPAGLPGGFVLSQTDGGFLKSQNETNTRPTQPSKQLLEESVISGPSEGVEDIEDLNPDDLDFNPAFASTQMTQRSHSKKKGVRQSGEQQLDFQGGVVKKASSSKGRITDGHSQIALVDHDYIESQQNMMQITDPGSVNQPQGGHIVKNVPVSPNITTKTLRDKLVRHSFTSGESLLKGFHSPNNVTRNQSPVPKRNSNSFYEFVNIDTSNKQVEHPEPCRSSTPPLFDDSQPDSSGPMSVDLNQIVNVVQQIGGQSKPSPLGNGTESCSSKNILIKKPLFKCSNKLSDNAKDVSVKNEPVSTVDSVCTGRRSLGAGVMENIIPNGMEDVEDFDTSKHVRKPFHNKLSRRNSMNASMNISHMESSKLDCSVETTQSGMTESSLKTDKSNITISKGTSKDNRRRKPIPKGVVFDEDDENEILNTRRSKRRRQGNQRTTPSKKQCQTGQDLVDDMNHMENSKYKQVSCHQGTCKKCCFRIFSTTADVQYPEEIPEFLKQNPSGNVENKSNSWCLLSRDDLVADCTHKASSNFNGMMFNSYWCEIESCCVQYLVCPQCRAQNLQSPRVIGVQVVSALDSAKPHLKPGRVWVLTDQVDVGS